MHDGGAGNKHITPFVTDFCEWTSSTVTTLGGIGADALISYGTGNVRMLALDSHGRPYCYTLYDVRYVPTARVRLLASEPERLRNVHVMSETKTQKRPHDGEGWIHVPWVVSSSHWFTKGMILHDDRKPLLPSTCGVPTRLREVKLQAARRAATANRQGSLIEPVTPVVNIGAFGATLPLQATSIATKQTRTDALLVAQVPTKGGSATAEGPWAPPVPATTALPAPAGGSAVHVQSNELPAVTQAPVMPHMPKTMPVSTIPMVEMFSGVGSASHYLRDKFHPVAAFDSDTDSQTVMAKHFPQCEMAGDFESVISGHASANKFMEAAEGARVGFANPPCSQTSIVTSSATSHRLRRCSL
jgi:hypothetical protein